MALGATLASENKSNKSRISPCFSNGANKIWGPFALAFLLSRPEEKKEETRVKTAKSELKGRKKERKKYNLAENSDSGQFGNWTKIFHCPTSSRKSE